MPALTTQEWVEKIQELDVDVTSTEDIERLRAAIGETEYDVDQVQQTACNAIVDFSGRLYTNMATEMNLSLSDDGDLQKLADELGEGTTPGQIREIAKTYNEHQSSELSEEQLDQVAGGRQATRSIGALSSAAGLKSLGMSSVTLKTRNLGKAGIGSQADANHAYW